MSTDGDGRKEDQMKSDSSSGVSDGSFGTLEWRRLTRRSSSPVDNCSPASAGIRGSVRRVETRPDLPRPVNASSSVVGQLSSPSPRLLLLVLFRPLFASPHPPARPLQTRGSSAARGLRS